MKSKSWYTSITAAYKVRGQENVMEQIALQAPRFVDGRAMRVVGLEGRYTREQTVEIPAQWDKFNADLYHTEVSGRVDQWTLGVVFPEQVMRYITGVEVAESATAPDGWSTVRVPAARYAVFAETGGIPAIRSAWAAIFSEWLPQSGMKSTGGAMVERYPADWLTSGDFEIWVPVGG